MPRFLKAICFSAIFLLCLNSSAAADSTTSLYTIDYTLSGGLYYHFGSDSYSENNVYGTGQLSGSEVLKRQYPYQFTGNFHDSPLSHGAIYFKSAFTGKFFNVLKAKADIFAEHRGMSYGVNNYDNIAVYPRFLMSLDTAVHVFDDTLRVHASTGHYYYPRLYEGLTIYNIETQGSTLSLQYKNFKLAYRKTGDLANSIGLGINDGDDIIFSLLKIPVTEFLKADVQFGAYRNKTIYDVERSNFIERNDINDFGETVSLAIYTDTTFRTYGQLGLRNGSADILARTAFLGGISYSDSFKNFSFSSKAEFRRYNYLFNYGYYNYDVNYRDTDQRQRNKNWGNTIGPQLYPLYAFERPFSQWAVFTEYVNKSVSAYTVNFDAKYKLPYDFFFKAGVDLNYIVAQDNETALYPFYAIGGGWEPFKNTSFNLFLSNKGMNLDKQYPTFVIFKKPYLNVAIKWNL